MYSMINGRATMKDYVLETSPLHRRLLKRNTKHPLPPSLSGWYLIKLWSYQAETLQGLWWIYVTLSGKVPNSLNWGLLPVYSQQVNRQSWEYVTVDGDDLRYSEGIFQNLNRTEHFRCGGYWHRNSRWVPTVFEVRPTCTSSVSEYRHWRVRNTALLHLRLLF